MVVIGKLINIQSDICQAEYVAGYPEVHVIHLCQPICISIHVHIPPKRLLMVSVKQLPRGLLSMAGIINV